VRVREEHRPLALAQVVAGRFAGELLVAEDPQDVVAQLEASPTGTPNADSEASRPASAPASTAPRCRGRSTVYLADLKCTTRMAVSRSLSPEAWATTSRNCPATTSVRQASR
jgi:hypothetical protein